MKKTIILAAALAVSTLANAQWTIEGSFSIGNLSHSDMAYDGSKFGSAKKAEVQSKFSFEPSIGYSFGDWEVGIGMAIASDNDIDCNIDTITSRSFGVNAYARRYFQLTDRLSWFMQGSVECYNNCAYYQQFNCPYTRIKGVSVSLCPGLEFELSEHWSIECEVNYLSIGYDIQQAIPLDYEKNVADDAYLFKQFTFSGNTEMGSLSEFFDEGLSIGLCYSF